MKNFKKGKFFYASFISLAFCLAFISVQLYNPLLYDDALISMRISRNFMEGNGLFHNLEEKVQTNTSLIYPLLFSPFQLLEKDQAILGVVAFDFFLFFLVILLVIRVLYKISDLGVLPFPKQLFLISLLNFALYSGRVVTPGMETQVYLLFILGTFYLRFSQKNWAILSSLSTFCRPEGSLLFWAIWIQERPKSGNLKKWIWLAGMPLLALVVFFFVSFWFYGSAIPHTILVKQNIRINYLDSLTFFIRLVLLDPWHLFLTAIQVTGVWYAIKNRRQEPVKYLGTYLLLYILFFTFGLGWNKFFGWYQMPVKVVLTLFGCLQLINWLKVGSNLLGISFFVVLAIFETYTYQRVSQNTQAGIRSAGKMLNQLTEGKPYLVTSEPLGFLSFYAMHCQFRDYPGLASRHSLRLLQENGPITVSNYFDNRAFREIILKSGGQLILLSRPEYASFKSMMDKEFEFICRIGKYSDFEFNSEFLVFANPKNLDEQEILFLKNKSKFLGY